jgi:predicted metalloendopeptidase
MRSPLVLFGAAGILFAGCAAGPAQHGAPPLRSGIDLQYVDRAVRPQDDIYEYLNGRWLKTFEIPADKAQYDSFTMINDQVQEQLRVIVDDLPTTPEDAETRKLVDLYAAFMDEAQVESRGSRPLQADFAAIDALENRAQIPGMIAHLQRIGAGAPFGLSVSQDAKDSTHYAVSLSQGGLGMPDRDYYLLDDPKLKLARQKYLAHIEKMLGMAGDAQPAASAAAILALETALARAEWSRVENRDPIKTYNKTTLTALPELMPEYDWRSYAMATAIDGRVDAVIIRQPGYFSSLGKLLATTPLPVWKNYFKWRVLSFAAPYLPKAFVDERFAFSGTVLRGVPENLPRWKRGITLLDGALGEALGKRYVAAYFPAQSKARMQNLVRNVLEAYRRDVDRLDWMSPETKLGAREKLAKLAPKIGYPDQWRDYGALRIERDDLLGNVVRANEFDFQRDIDKLGKPIDRNEWSMTPQTVNAYYNPTRNEIVFPAAILQPPFFDSGADDAVIYGGIGAVIGHEISHGFDDRGSQYDADGNLHDWFTKADHEQFARRTQALVQQYDAYTVAADYHVNGALTLGENIGDNSGLAIAFEAYQLSLAGRPASIIDGLTGVQRLYLGWVQVWRGKMREAESIQRIKTDPHSPDPVRAVAPLRNQDAFYEAFGVKRGDSMYLPPEQRVRLW